MIPKNCVSVIIPNFNNSQWLESCIQSCIDQGEFLKEIIFVDDDSTDNSLDIVKSLRLKFPDVIKVFSNPAKGANNARNFGLTKTTGEYIQWLDSDDRIVPGKFKYQLDALKNNDIDIAYSDWRMDFYEDGNLVKKEIRKSKVYDDYLYELIKDNWTCPHNYLISRKFALLLYENEGWNPATRVSQDREYFTLAGLLGAKFMYVPGEYSVYNRWSSNTISGMDFQLRIELNQKLELRFRQIIEDFPSGPKKQRYLKVLNTQLIVACYYNRNIIIDRRLFPWDIKWNLIHWKMRIILPFLLFVQNFKRAFLVEAKTG